MSPTLLEGPGGRVTLPDKVLCDRADGGHLVVHPPRPVWDRSALGVEDLLAWSLLVAATGAAMLQTLPALQEGCLNFWEAGNWSLHDLAAPVGPKSPREHRRVHLHVFGRSRHARHPDWAWGESPRFPAYVDSARWSAQFAPLSNAECDAVAAAIDALLRSRYAPTATRGRP